MPVAPIITYILWLAAIFAAGGIAMRVTPKPYSPAVVEILGGVFIGNLGLVGVSFFEPMKQSGVLHALSLIAVSFLLFQVGLESTIVQMKRLGPRALAVALTGIAATFLLGLLACPYLIPGLEGRTYAFIAAALTATSVGISARILKDAGKTRERGSQIVIGAAVIDDIVGLVLLVLMTTLVRTDAADPSSIAAAIARVLALIAGALLIGRLAAHVVPGLLDRVAGKSNGTLITALLFFALFGLAFFALGLPPIIGCFIGGLVLERKRFRGKDPETLELEWMQTERVVGRLGKFLIPVFFVMTGVSADLAAAFTPRTLTTALGLAAVAVAGKLACGLPAGKGATGRIVGAGMVPRGEVQLIYAGTGLALGILSAGVYSALVLVVLLTTILAPVALMRILRSENAT
ncbi:MAG TPA: cation:proton antiporter [Bacteroidota bacterium]|nr:cation:proton antiporter [Bacteroidota bacterium]